MKLEKSQKSEIALIFFGTVLCSFLLFKAFFISLGLGFFLGSLFSIARIFFIHKRVLFYFNALLYWLLIYSESISQLVVSYQAIIFYVILTILAAYTVEVASDVAIRKSVKIPAMLFSYFAYLCLLLSALFFIGFQINFGTKPNDASLYAVLQTDWQEIFEFIKLHLNLSLVVVGFLFAAMSIFIFVRIYKIQNQINLKRTIINFIILITISLFGFQHYKNLNFTVGSTFRYFNEVRAFKNNQKQRAKYLSFEKVSQKPEADEIHVVVIGESLNKKHMGLYGYLRDTSPLLIQEQNSNEGEFIKLNNAYSHHTHTIDVLKLALTEANNFNQKEFFSSPSIVDISKESGMESYWITNQQLLGEWDSLVSVIAHSSDHLVALNENVGKSYFVKNKDEQLIPILDEVLNKEKSLKSKFIIVHLIGSHWNYCEKYSEPFNVYQGPLQRYEFGSYFEETTQSHNPINCYDNSVLYNDHVVYELLKILKNKDVVSSFTFFSDHSEDVLGGKAHESTNYKFSMSDIPYIIWLSEKYKNRYPEKVASLKRHQDELYPNDLVYDTLIGMMNIHTKHYEAVYDLSSDKYHFDDSKPSILNKFKYTSPKNIFWHQSRNAKWIHDMNLNHLILPHRVDSVGKLKDVVNDQLYSFEIDLTYDKDKNILEVGHDSTSMSGQNFQTYLERIDSRLLKKIWLDLKNIDENNVKKVIQILDTLDKKFHIKNKSIFESASTSQALKIARQSGFHTSYYLPTEEILELMNQNEKSASEKFGILLQQRINHLNVSAISFDCRLYPFVKKYIESGIGKKVLYHTWDLSIRFYEYDFLSRIEKTDYLADRRVNTILYPYLSYFEL